MSPHLSRLLFLLSLSGLSVAVLAQEKAQHELQTRVQQSSTTTQHIPLPIMAAAPVATSSSPTARLWNLQNADIVSVINEVSRETGKNFIVDPRVQGKVTIVSSKPMDANEIYQVFLAVLQTHGFSAIQSGNVVKIVPDVEAKQAATPLADTEHPGYGDELVVRVIPVQNVPADQFLSVLRPMLPQSGDISAYMPSNTLIVSGRAEKIERIVDIVHQVDKADNNFVEVIPLRRATAAELVKVINSLQPANNRMLGQVLQTSLAADDRTNSILLSGDQQNRLRMRTLIAQLDRPGSNASPQGNTRVIYLHYLKAKDLVPILRGLEGDMTATETSATDNDAKDVSDKSIKPTYYENPLHVTASSSATTASPVANPAAPIVSGNKKVQIQAEPNTNAVIISAPPAEMQSLKSIIAQLDIRPAQVLVEAIIVELDENKLKQLGIEWGTRSQPGSPNAGDAFSNFTGGLGIGFINRGNLRVLVSALGTDASSNILATPSLVVLDNQKAVIKVGKQVPTVTGSYPSNSAGSNVQPFTTSDYKDVVLKLKVTPQINQSNAIRLHIEQGNDTLANQTGVSNNPIFNTAMINTDVMVNSGQILVLGGLLNNDLEGKDTKVPILGDIPGLGVLFHSKDNTLDKKNLVVFLRPVILHDEATGTVISARKYNDTRREQILRQGQADYATPEGGNLVIPPLNRVNKLPVPFDVK